MSATAAARAAGAAEAGAGLVADSPPVSLGVLDSANDLAKSSWRLFITAEDDDDDDDEDSSFGTCRPFGTAIANLGACDRSSSARQSVRVLRRVRVSSQKFNHQSLALCIISGFLFFTV